MENCCRDVRGLWVWTGRWRISCGKRAAETTWASRRDAVPRAGGLHPLSHVTPPSCRGLGKVQLALRAGRLSCPTFQLQHLWLCLAHGSCSVGPAWVDERAGVAFRTRGLWNPTTSLPRSEGYRPLLRLSTAPGILLYFWAQWHILLFQSSVAAIIPFLGDVWSLLLHQWSAQPLLITTIAKLTWEVEQQTGGCYRA